MLTVDPDELRPWKLAIRRICRNRSNRFYMPGMLLIVLDLLDAEHATPERLPYDEELRSCFDHLMESLGEKRGKAYMPFNFLASQSEVWHLRRGELTIPPFNPPPRDLGKRIDYAEFRSELQPLLKTRAGRQSVRHLLFSALDLNGKADPLLHATDVEFAHVRDFQTHLVETLDEPFNELLLRERSLVQTMRYARSRAFAREVLAQYDYACALCQSSIRFSGLGEVQAAHIWGVAEGGPDDLRNGLALCRTHHWCFDNYLWSVDSDHSCSRKCYAPYSVRIIRPSVRIIRSARETEGPSKLPSPSA